MAKIQDLQNVMNRVEAFVQKLGNELIFSGEIFFKESPNAKLQVIVQLNASLVLEMAFWQNDYCRCEAVDLDSVILIFEDERLTTSIEDSSTFMCEKIQTFNDYIEEQMRDGAGK